MSNPITLIHLVSEQTIQNLLPILRLRPRRIVHLVTPKTAGRAAHLGRAAAASGVKAEDEVVQLSDMPGVRETRGAIEHCIDEVGNGDCVVNFTGGTKLMSIGSFAGAAAREVPSLYVDTQNQCFVDGATSSRMGKILGGDWSFSPILRSIKVDVLALANGVARVTGGRKWDDHLDLATLLYSDRVTEEQVHAAIHGDQGLTPRGREPRNASGWLELIDKPIGLPDEVARLAVDSGWLRRDQDGRPCLPDTSRDELAEIFRLQKAGKRVPDFPKRYFGSVGPLQESLTFLSGGWWEIIVADAMDRSGLMRDLRWSVQVGRKGGPDLEEDLLALSGVRLACVSCKRGGRKARLLPLLEETAQRAVSIGGSFSQKYLAILVPPTGRVATNLNERARALGVRLVTGENVYDLETFAN